MLTIIRINLVVRVDIAGPFSFGTALLFMPNSVLLPKFRDGKCCICYHEQDVPLSITQSKLWCGLRLLAKQPTDLTNLSSFSWLV